MVAFTGPSDVKAARRARFEAVWNVLRDELVDYLKVENMPSHAQDWYQKNLDYNVPGGKLNRGISVVEYFKAATLGWCVELLQAYFLVADDMMDQSITRRGQPCWFRLNTVGNIAINDAFMLEAAIYFLLKKHFRSESYYVDLIELFHDTTFQTEMGQLIDLVTASEDVVDLSKFSLDTHALIVIYKTAFYSFYLPVALAMRIAGVPDSYVPAATPGSAPVSAYKVALDILVPLGKYFQVQDDFLDYSQPPELLGKIGTDIIDNKCSWCINTALAKATSEQRAVLDACYGRKDAEKEKEVKRIFREVGVEAAYHEYEETTVAQLREMIEAVPEGTRQGELKRAVFTGFLAKIYRRSK